MTVLLLTGGMPPASGKGSVLGLVIAVFAMIAVLTVSGMAIWFGFKAYSIQSGRAAYEERVAIYASDVRQGRKPFVVDREGGLALRVEGVGGNGIVIATVSDVSACRGAVAGLAGQSEAIASPGRRYGNADLQPVRQRSFRSSQIVYGAQQACAGVTFPLELSGYLLPR